MICFVKPGVCSSLRCVLLPLLGCTAPSQALFVLVDSVDEGCLTGDRDQRSANIAELLAAHHELFPPWLLLVCSARRQNKHITKLFTGDPLHLHPSSDPTRITECCVCVCVVHQRVCYSVTLHKNELSHIIAFCFRTTVGLRT